MTSRSLPIAGVREPPARARRHAVAAVVVGGYMLAGAIVVVMHQFLTTPRWLALHLIGLGAATNAVLVWSRHFAQALLHARLAAERAAHVRLLALNTAVVVVLVGVETGARQVAAAAGLAVVVVLGWHVSSLVTMARRNRLPGPLRRVVAFFVASGFSLVVGAGFGAALAGGWSPDDSTVQQRLHLAHAQLNLFGWIGMAVLGAEVVLWPAVVRTRMAPQATRLAPIIFAAAVCGLSALTAGILADNRPVAVAGAAAYASGVALAFSVMMMTLAGHWPRTPSAWWLAVGTAWLFAGVVVDASRLATTKGADLVLQPVVPIVLLGLVVQVLIGALTFLLPVTVGGGPSGNRRMAATLETRWRTRFVLANAGTLLVASPAPAGVHVAGWALALTGFGSFLPLLATALTRSETARSWKIARRDRVRS